jgi:hypothetical protein
MLMTVMVSIVMKWWAEFLTSVKSGLVLDITDSYLYSTTTTTTTIVVAIKTLL